MADKYGIRKFEPVNNKEYDFYEVSVNGKYLYQKFIEGLKDTKDTKKLYQIYAYMDSISPSIRLPLSKFRQIKGLQRNDIYEFKKSDIRIYVLMKAPNVFVLLGGYKGSQDKDIKRVGKLFNDF